MSKIKKVIQNILSVKNQDIHKVITIFGIKFKIQYQKFPKNSKNLKYISNKTKNIANSIIFVTYNSESCIPENTIQYLKELRKHTDYLIVIGDNPIIPEELNKIKTFVDAYQFKKHGEYDFGSYKRGFNILKNLGILNQLKSITFCNDSVLYVGKNLDDVFEKQKPHPFFGLTINSYGYSFKPGSNVFDWSHSPHIQSYFFSVSDKIFTQKWFYNFFKNVKREKLKKKLIAKYEIGLSSLILSKGFQLNSYYPPTEKDYDLCHYYLGNNDDYTDEKLFIKKKYLTK